MNEGQLAADPAIREAVVDMIETYARGQALSRKAGFQDFIEEFAFNVYVDMISYINNFNSEEFIKQNGGKRNDSLFGYINRIVKLRMINEGQKKQYTEKEGFYASEIDERTVGNYYEDAYEEYGEHRARG